MTIGTIFQATDKLGRTYTYQLDNINPNCKMREYILVNLDLKCNTEVELEWFNQRKISIQTHDKNAIVTGSRVGENMQGSKVLYITHKISKEYAKEHDLNYRNRETMIIMNRAVGDESAELISYGIA